MAREFWTVRLTIDSSSKECIRELARAARRSTSNYISLMIEQKAQEAANERQAG